MLRCEAQNIIQKQKKKEMPIGFIPQFTQLCFHGFFCGVSANENYNNCWSKKTLIKISWSHLFHHQWQWLSIPIQELTNQFEDHEKKVAGDSYHTINGNNSAASAKQTQRGQRLAAFISGVAFDDTKRRRITRKRDEEEDERLQLLLLYCLFRFQF